jgi:hypothetical protein
MQGQYAKGMLVVLMNCAEPGREQAFNAWYNDIHVPDVIATEWVTSGRRYRNLAPDLQPNEARYLALYETDRWDMEDMLDDIRTTHTPRWRDQNRLTTDARLAMMGVFRKCGPPWRPETSPFATERTGKADITGLLLQVSVCTEPAKEGEFNDWYNRRYVPEAMAAGPFHTAYRYANSVREPEGGRRFLTLFETDAPDPASAVSKFLTEWQPSRQRLPCETQISTSTFEPIFARIPATA